MYVVSEISTSPTPLTFVDRSAAAADNLAAPYRCHSCCVLILLQFSIRKFCGYSKSFRESLKKHFWATPPRCTAVAPPPTPTKIDQRAAADTMTSALGSNPRSTD